MLDEATSPQCPSFPPRVFLARLMDRMDRMNRMNRMNSARVRRTVHARRQTYRVDGVDEVDGVNGVDGMHCGNGGSSQKPSRNQHTHSDTQPSPHA